MTEQELTIAKQGFDLVDAITEMKVDNVEVSDEFAYYLRDMIEAITVLGFDKSPID